MKLVCTTPFHPCLSEAVDLRGAARKLLFVHGVRFAALLGLGGGSILRVLFIVNVQLLVNVVRRR